MFCSTGGVTRGPGGHAAGRVLGLHPDSAQGPRARAELRPDLSTDHSLQCRQ